MKRGEVLPFASMPVFLVLVGVVWFSMRPTEADRQRDMEALALGIAWPAEYEVSEPHTELPKSNWKSSTSGTTSIRLFAPPDNDPNEIVGNIAELLEDEGFLLHDDATYFRCREDQISFMLSRRTTPPFIADVAFTPAHTTSSGGLPGTEVERPPSTFVRFYWTMENEPGQHVFGTGKGQLQHCPDIVGA